MFSAMLVCSSFLELLIRQLSLTRKDAILPDDNGGSQIGLPIIDVHRIVALIQATQVVFHDAMGTLWDTKPPGGCLCEDPPLHQASCHVCSSLCSLPQPAVGFLPCALRARAI